MLCPRFPQKQHFCLGIFFAFQIKPRFHVHIWKQTLGCSGQPVSPLPLVLLHGVFEMRFHRVSQDNPLSTGNNFLHLELACVFLLLSSTGGLCHPASLSQEDFFSDSF